MTLLDLAKQVDQLAKDASDAAQIGLAKAKTTTAAADQAHSDAVAKVATLSSDIDSLRGKLAGALTKADADGFAAQLEAKTILLRAAHSALADAAVALGEARDAEAAATAALTGTASALSDADAVLVTITVAAAQRDIWVTAITTDVANVRGDATAAIDTPPANKPYTDAKARIEGDIPAALITRARERRQQAAARLASLGATVAAAEAASTAALGLAFNRAVAALRDYVVHAQALLDKSVKQLTAVADPTNAPLSANERAQVNDVAITAPGTVAATDQQNRDGLLDTVYQKQSLLDNARLAAVEADPDSPVDANAAVISAAANLKTARDNWAAAEATFAGVRNDLDVWEAALPDATWQLLDDFEEASAALKYLRDLDPGTLVTAMTAAEAAWVTALAAAGKKVRVERAVQAEIARRASISAAEQVAAPAGKFSATRGDR